MSKGYHTNHMHLLKLVIECLILANVNSNSKSMFATNDIKYSQYKLIRYGKLSLPNEIEAILTTSNKSPYKCTYLVMFLRHGVIHDVWKKIT